MTDRVSVDAVLMLLSDYSLAQVIYLFIYLFSFFS